MSAVLIPPRSGSSPWRTALPAFVAVLFTLLWLYRGTMASMVTIWSRSDTFAHAFLVMPISIWLIWRQRAQLAAMTPRPQPWLLLPLAVVAGCWLIGELAAVNAATQLGYVAMLVLLVPAMFGLAVARAITFPLLFLFFMAPFGEFLMPSLMEATADVTVAALTLSGVPVFREGLQFVIPTGNWSVVEACSGIRYLIASFMVGLLFAYLNYRSTRRRLVFAAVSIVVPVLANWFRAYMIVMLGHLSDNRLATGVDHIIYGWVFFGIVIMTMFFIGGRWSEAPAEHPLPAPGGAPVAAPDIGWGVAAAAMVILAAPAWFVWQVERAATAPGPTLTLPATLSPGWTAAARDGIGFRPVFLNPTVEVQRSYKDPDNADGPEVGVHIAYFRNQRYEHKVASSENMLARSEDRRWHQVEAGRETVDVGDRRLVWNTGEVLGPPAPGETFRPRLGVRQIYWVNGSLTERPAWAAALGVIGRLSGHGDEGASIVIYSYGEDRAQTARRLDKFASDNLAALESVLAAARASR